MFFAFHCIEEVNEGEDQTVDNINQNIFKSPPQKKYQGFLPDIHNRNSNPYNDESIDESKDKVSPHSMKGKPMSNIKSKSANKFSKSLKKKQSSNLLVNIENLTEDNMQSVNFLQIKSIYSNFTSDMKIKIKEKGLTSNQEEEEAEEDKEKKELEQKLNYINKIRKVEVDDMKNKLKKAQNVIKLLMKDARDPVFKLSNNNLDDFISRCSSEEDNGK